MVDFGNIIEFSDIFHICARIKDRDGFFFNRFNKWIGPRHKRVKRAFSDYS
jgi:hypothetical protein